MRTLFPYTTPSRSRQNAQRGYRDHAAARKGAADAIDARAEQVAQRLGARLATDGVGQQGARQGAAEGIGEGRQRREYHAGHGDQHRHRKDDQATHKVSGEERTSVVEGKRVSVRVELGGRRIMKKKKKKNKKKNL